ncbi:tail fiber domain-containing protein [Ligilactobacillus salivarius]|uniref:tail fiber domain-containing protein n=1 Tax=Ligilactobacillus salivarius TaxID=1624 RepID=UPI000BAEBE36|nr:tail fiber domain-containing protein [Ligilactobacillus salivarius]PAY53505.1 hypothetical protein A8C37_04925 [Ligilactobacillus salivarius]
MYKQSNEAKLAYQSAERTLDIVVNVNGVDYKATDIEQFDYDSGGYTGDTFSIGSTYENNITVKFIHLVEGLKRGMIVKPKIGIKLPSGTFEYTPLGVFIIADEIQMDRNNNSTTIKAYDKFVVMEGQYVSKLTYPANAVDIITEIAQMCKVDVNTNDLAHLPTIKVSKAITKQSYRTAIGWIAQLYVGFASFDRDGKLTIRRVAEPNYTIEPSEYEQQGLVKNEAPYIIGGISCNINVVETTNNGETNETTHKLHSGSVNGSQIELTNDIMTQGLLDSIWDSLKTITFYPFSLNWFGNPAIEAGDWLSLKDMKGNVFVVPNNGYTISFNGGLSSTSKADQNATDSSNVKYTGELTRAIENYSRRQAPDGTNIYTDVKEPTDAKFNDVWFKPNGNSTELWIFERQSDGTGKWVKQPVNGEVEQKINDALKDFDELDKSFKDNANTQSATNELMKSRIDSISNQIPNLSDEISRVNGSVTSLKTQTDKDRQQLQTTSQNLDQARQDVLSNSNRIDKLSVGLDSVNINVNNVNSKVDGIQIGGGKNLVRGTSGDWTGVGRDEFNGSDNQTHLIGLAYLDQLKVGDSVTVTCNYQYSGVTNANAEAQIQGWGNVTKWGPGQFPRQTTFAMQTGNDLYKGSINYTFKLTADMVKNRYWELAWRFNYVNQGAWFQWLKFKVEKGSVATPWSPAPEDEIERVSQLKVDLNGVTETVATNKGDIAQIKLTENGMQQSIKDAQGNISTLQNDSKQFKQQFQDVNGSIATITNTANSLSSQLSTKAGTSEYNSFKEQTAQELRTKLTASDLNGYAKSADVKVSVDGLNARFDNLSVGGTNLLRKTSNEWKTWTGTGWANNTVDGGYINLEPGTYTFRAEIDNTGNTQRGVHAELYVVSEKKFLDQIAKSYTQTFVNAGSKGYVTTTFTIDKALTDVAIHPHAAVNSAIPSTVTIKWRKEKLEKGNVATDWSPAPEDMENKIEVLSGKITANSNEFSTVYSKITNAKNDAINTIKGDSQWQSMGKIVTNAAFLQTADGFAQEVVRTTTPIVNGGGKNLARGTSDSWQGVYEFNGGTNFTKQVADVYLDDLNVGDKVTIQIIYQYRGVTSNNAQCWLQGAGNVTGWNGGNFYGTPTTINMQTGTDLKYGSAKYTFDITADMKKNRYWSVAYRFDNVNRGAWFQWLKFKVEKGSVATPWIPAPEDLATKLQLNQVIDTADSHTRTISDYLTGSNSRFVQMANYLNMNVGNSSVSVNGNGVMLSGNRIKITGKTLIDNAVILDALIKDINANTVKTKELDASKINVTNLNADNITSGTISGTNLNINLDSGNVSFQSGRIHSSNDYVDINIDQKYISTADNLGRLLFKGSSLQIAGSNIFDNSDDYYLKIDNGMNGGSWAGANITGRDYISISNKANSDGFSQINAIIQTNFAGISAGKSTFGWEPTFVGGADRGVYIAGGKKFSSPNPYKLDEMPSILIGTNQSGDGWYSNRVIINGSYVHIPETYNKTTSAAPNVYVANDGALVRSTSAAKYKTDIVRSHDLDYGNKILNVPIATWIDKAEFERYAKKESEQPPIRHFGMIAEDLADVGLEMLVTRNESGELEGIQYDRIAPALIPVIADLKRRLENLERKQQTNE